MHLATSPKNGPSALSPATVTHGDRVPGADDAAIKVLVVDDEADIVEELVELLEDEGFEPFSTTNPADAPFIMQENPDIGIVISDIRMPGMDGLDLSQMILDADHNRDIRIIVLTGHAGMEEAIRALKIGVEDFLTKPVNPDHLLHTVSRAAEINRLRKQDRDFKVRLAMEVKDRTREARELSRQLTRKNTELKEKNRSLDRMNRLKDEFLGMISHELNTPLNAIIGFSQMITERFDKADDADGVELSSLITVSGELMHRKVQDILLMTSVQAGTLAAQNQEIMVSDIFEAVSHTINKASGDNSENPNVTVSVSIADDVETINADSPMIIRALEVLAHNAVLFSPEGSEVELAAAITSGGLRFSVLDHGPGMNPEKLKQAMMPLTQGDGSLSRNHEGMGLGIPLAKGLVETMGGTFKIKSIPEKGTEVIVVFPNPSSKL